MSNKKITKNLQSYLQKNKQETKVEVIIELSPILMVSENSNVSQHEKITFYKERFNRELEQITPIIIQEGGIITGSAWINQTIRAKIPIKGIEKLTKFEKITAIDLPNRLTEE